MSGRVSGALGVDGARDGLDERWLRKEGHQTREAQGSGDVAGVLALPRGNRIPGLHRKGESRSRENFRNRKKQEKEREGEEERKVAEMGTVLRPLGHGSYEPPDRTESRSGADYSPVERPDCIERSSSMGGRPRREARAYSTRPWISYALPESQRKYRREEWTTIGSS